MDRGAWWAIVHRVAQNNKDRVWHGEEGGSRESQLKPGATR